MPEKETATPVASGAIAEAERIKALGNDAYKAGKHAEAVRLYSDAIEKNSSNAIYYANRAAALLGQKRYIEAVRDCEKAVEIDPKYSRAWQRLGVAATELLLWQKVVNAYEKALEGLPTTLSLADRTLQATCTQALKQAKARMKSTKCASNPPPPSNSQSGKMPWEVANAFAGRKATKSSSCVFILNAASQYLENALKILSEVKTAHRGIATFVQARGGVVQDVTNAILCDDRAFRVKDPEFTSKMAMQILHENTMFGGWESEGAPDPVKQRVRSGLRQGSQDTVRRALTITIRCWVWRAFSQRQAGDLLDALTTYEKALEILEWGSIHVPEQARGEVFHPSFVRAVQHAYVNTLRKYLLNDPSQGGYLLNDLIDLATKITKGVDEEVPLTQNDGQNGFILSGWYYPKASALAHLGWCAWQKSSLCAVDDPEKEANLKSAAEFYKLAAKVLPTDDALYVDFTRERLDCLVALGAPLRDTLPICERICSVMPDVLEIWASAPVGDRLRKNHKDLADFATKYTKLVGDGECTLDTVGELAPMERVNVDEGVWKPESDLTQPIGHKRPDKRRAKMKDIVKKI